jgi:predicted Zn-dependent protease
MSTRLAKLTSAIMLALLALVSAQGDPQAAAPTPEDHVLRAMKTELERSTSKLKLDQIAAPYYIDYQIVDVDQRTAEAAYGALRSDLHMRLRFLHVVVRVGDYKQDSYFGQGEGVVDYAPVDDEELALRTHLWLATDQAYKIAIGSLAAKQAQLKQLTIDQPVDDFAHADPVQHLEPLAKLDADTTPWLKTMQDATAVYKTDLEVQSLTSSLEARAVNRYFINSEGTTVRTGETSYQVRLEASTQAADGMRLDHSAAYTVKDLKDLPAPGKFIARAGELIGTLKNLRAAPLADEEYRGPVLFSSDAAAVVLMDLIGGNIRGLRPNLGQNVRTLGAFASNYKSRVLPEFLSVVDDPTLESYKGKPLFGHYEVDEEGVKAERVLAIDKGKLVNYLMGRQPIRDFPKSNGHGRARPAGPPEPSLGTLMVTTSESAPPAELKKKLVDLCQQRGQPYGYFVDAMSGPHNPRLLYRVWAKDGHEELIRGAVFEDLDVRSLRNNLIAAGDDMNAWSGTQGVPHSVVNPSILFDELEVKRADNSKSKLPEYSSPPLTPAK